MAIEWEFVADTFGDTGTSVPPKLVEARGTDVDLTVSATVTDLWTGGGAFPEARVEAHFGMAALASVEGPALHWGIGTAKSSRQSLLCYRSRFAYAVDFSGGDLADPADVTAIHFNAGFLGSVAWMRYFPSDSIWVAVVNDATAGGNNWYIYRSSDDGQTWQRGTRPGLISAAPTPVCRSAGAWITEIDRKIAVGTTPAAFTTTHTTAAGSGVSNFAAIGSTVVAAGTGNTERLWRSTDDGATWAAVSPTYPTTPSSVASIAWRDVSVVGGRFVARVNYPVAGGPIHQQYVASSSDGATWTFTAVSTGFYPTLEQRIAADVTGSYAVRYSQLTSGGPLTEFVSTNGTSWSATGSTVSGSITSTPSLSPTSDGDIYRAVQTGDLQKTSNGSAWTTIANGIDLPSATADDRYWFEVGPYVPPRDQLLNRRLGSGTWSTALTVPGKTRMTNSHSGPIMNGSRNTFTVLAANARETIDPSAWARESPTYGSSWVSLPDSLATSGFAGTLAVANADNTGISGIQIAYAPWLDRWFTFGTGGTTVCTIWDPSDWSSTVITSPGNTRSRITMLTSSALYQLRWGGGTGDLGMFESFDGVTWTRVLGSVATDFDNRSLTQGTWTFAYAPEVGLFGLAQNFSSVVRLLTSSAGTSPFTVVSSDPANFASLWADGVFYQLSASSGAGAVRVSEDCVTWHRTDISGMPSFVRNWRLRCTNQPLPLTPGGWSVGMIQW